MAKIMDPILPILYILEYWAIILGFFAGPDLLEQDIAYQPSNTELSFVSELGCHLCGAIYIRQKQDTTFSTAS